ncbi:Flp pilus assembly protein CpaB [Hydrogenovibrio sp. 3SP14C1]|uniref:Flp pilus assembly protein CpaB n=1 Tax=Hydrogenovibrio sp. 3SP14C1 TaxID=3038774 RepID=UPI0024179B39|nr:Flp pilus assembly protein CpaB [Hydrogenovibrio sp. 3SP14C1]MDG4812299.1 Flp pilus assembly protein CpaB [Hydrogenovibrio sp. 3SP14C1]
MKLKTSDWVVYGIAALSAILAIVLVYGYVQNRVAEAEANAGTKTITVVEKPELHSIVVASRDIYRGEQIEADDVKVLNVPMEGLVVKGVIVNPQNAVGHVAHQNIYAGEWILAKKLKSESQSRAQSVEALLDEKRRAIRLPIDPGTGLLGIISPGDHVDIISVFESADSKRMVSRTILQNISVLSIGIENQMRGNASESDDSDNTFSKSNRNQKSMIALDVDTNQAEKLALAMNVGAIHLLLRNSADTELVETKGANLKVMEKGQRRPPKYKPKKKRDVIELMQGGNVQEVITR